MEQKRVQFLNREKNEARWWGEEGKEVEAVETENPD